MYDLRWPRTKPHAPALVANATLLFEQRNDRLRCIFVELGAVCVSYPADVSGEFDRRHLHAETKTEIWNLMLAGETCSIDFSLYAANAKATWNQNAGNILQSPIHAVLQQFSIDKLKIDPTVFARGRMRERFIYALVCVAQVDVFANHSDLDAFLRTDDAPHKIFPTR